MNIKNWHAAFTLLLFLFIFSACSDDDDNNKPDPITLTDMITGSVYNTEYRNLWLTPFSSEKIFEIRGGDGQYDILNLNKDVAEISYNGKWLVLNVLSKGSTTLKIWDNSGNILELYVDINYLKKSFYIIQRFPYVVGEDLTIKQKNQLEEDIVNDIPVATEGRYEFTFTSENNEGEVLIYPTRMGKSRKGTFSIQRIVNDEWPDYNQYTIIVEDEEWIFADLPYANPNTRAVNRSPRMLVEDVTAKYKEEYPTLEQAYAIQGYTY